MSNPDDNIELQMRQAIVGTQMTPVEFVMDYVQLRFGGPVPVVTAVTLPSIIIGN